MVRGSVVFVFWFTLVGCFSAPPVGNDTLIACNSDEDCPSQSACLVGLCRLSGFVLPTAPDLVISVIEDQPADFGLPEGTAAVLQLPLLGELTLVDDTGIFVPAPNFVGTVTATYTISRDGITSDAGTLTFVIEGQNDAPVLQGTAITLDEDSAATVVTPFADPDFGDAFTVSVLDDVPVGGHLGTLVPLAGAAGVFTYQANANQHGSDRFVVQLSDAAGAIASATIDVTIVPVDDRTVLLQPVIVVEEDGVRTLSFDELFADADGPVASVVLMIDDDRLALGVDDDARTITFTPTLDTFGVFPITAMVEADTALGLEVNITNASDLFAAVPFEGTINEDAREAMVGQLQVSGAPVGSLVFSLISGPLDWPSDSVQVSTSGVVTATPPANLTGAASFRWRAVADGDFDNGVVEGDGVLNVASVPDPLVLVAPATVVGDEDEELIIGFDVIDVDDPLGDHELTASVSVGMVRTDGGRVLVSPPNNFYGTINVQVTATSADGRVSNVASITATIQPVIDPPTFDDFSIVVDEDSALRFTPDVITDLVEAEFSVERMTGATGTLDVISTVLLYQPAADFAGTEQWLVTARTGDQSATATMTVVMTPSNDAPRIVEGQVFTCTEDRSCPLSLAMVDPDSPNSAMQVSSTDPRLSQSNDGSVLFALDRNFNGNLIVPIVVSDGDKTSAATVVAIQVLPAADDLLLTVTAPAFDEDGVGFIFADVTDVDGVGYRLEVNPTFAGGVCDSSFIGSDVVVLRPNPNFNGNPMIEVRAIPTTGTTVRRQASVTIRPVNDPPQLVFEQNTFLGGIDASTEVALIATDVDGDSLAVDATATFEGGVQAAANVGAGRFVVLVNPADRGVRAFSYFELQVTIADPTGAQAFASRSLGQLLASDCSLLATTNGSAPADEKLVSGTTGCKTVSALPFTPALGWIDEPPFGDPLWRGDGNGWNDNTKQGVGPGYLALSSLWRFVRTDQVDAETNLVLPSRREMRRHFDTRLSRLDFEWEDLNINCGDEVNIDPGSSRLSCRDNPNIGFGLSVENDSEQIAIYVMASDFRTLGLATCDEHENRGAFISGLYLDDRGAEVECTF
jgi:hypothetical protein